MRSWLISKTCGPFILGINPDHSGLVRQGPTRPEPFDVGSPRTPLKYQLISVTAVPNFVTVIFLPLSIFTELPEWYPQIEYAAGTLGVSYTFVGTPVILPVAD